MTSNTFVVDLNMMLNSSGANKEMILWVWLQFALPPLVSDFHYSLISTLIHHIALYSLPCLGITCSCYWNIEPLHLQVERLSYFLALILNQIIWCLFHYEQEEPKPAAPVTNNADPEEEEDEFAEKPTKDPFGHLPKGWAWYFVVIQEHMLHFSVGLVLMSAWIFSVSWRYQKVLKK